jgi:hypothetical protein
MLRKLQSIVCLVCMLTYAEAATVSIGTIMAGGDMRVDSVAVKGNATLFDGSTVETGQTAAELRMSKDVELLLAADSSGRLYRDHMVLQKGRSEIRSSKPFQLEASGLRIVSSSPNSHGFVLSRSTNSVEVSSLTGDFQVTTTTGVALATVPAGKTFLFSKSAEGAIGEPGGGGGAGGGAGGGQAAPAGTGGHTSVWLWVILVGTVGGIIGIEYAVGNSGTPASR